MNANGFEQWGGYMEAKITKLEEQFSTGSNPYRKSNLFSGISIFVNGLTNPSADELKRIMMVHGGTYHHYERSHTTYIIASNLPDVKVRNMNTSKIISPQWVVDSVKEMRVLDYTRYLLYTNQKVSQPSLVFKNVKKRDESDQSKKENHNATQCNNVIVQADTSILRDEKSSGKDLARTAVDPKFLSEFYNNSRLHHIATLGAGFKQYVSDLRDQHGKKDFPARKELKEKLNVGGNVNAKTSTKYVMHIDMDCFFVSVGLRKYPELKGQPVAVTHSKGGASANEVPVHPSADRKTEMELFATRFEQHLHNNILSEKVRGGFEAKMSLSEIASCSYEARAKGIRNGMFVGKALNLCPELKTIPYDFEGYREVAYTLYDTIAQYTLNIEAVSCDEMFVDLTEVLDEMQVEPMDFVRAVREEVRAKTGCPCSAGIGGNKLQARMATKQAKPDGQYLLLPEVAEEYMANIKIEELPGVGSSTAYTLKNNNLVTCGDLQMISLLKLQMHVGKKFGETLHQFCRGIDNRPLTYGQIRKSVSAEVNYGIRFKEFSELETFLRQLCTEVHTRLTDIKRRTKCITLKVMVRAKDAPLEAAKFMGHGVCDHVTKSVSLSDYTSDVEVIIRTVIATMKALTIPPNELRGVGIQLSKLNDPNEGKAHKENAIMNMFSKVTEKRKDKISEPSDNNSDCIISDNAATINANVPIINKPESNEHKSEQNQKNNGKRSRGKAIGCVSEKKSKKTPDILDLMQKAKQKQPVVSANKTATINNSIPKDIDPDVFAALPTDIRNEILQAHNQSTQQTTKPVMPTQPLTNSNLSILNESDFQPSTSKAAEHKKQRKQLQKLQKQQDNPNNHPYECNSTVSHIDPEFLAALPQELRMELEKEYAQLPGKSKSPDLKKKPSTQTPANPGEQRQEIQISADNIFMQVNCKEMILAWLKSADKPEVYDVDLIAKHAEELVSADEIDTLYTPLIYLCKLINHQKSSGTPNDCVWHKAYIDIIKVVQKRMTEAYNGRSLFLGAKLKCDNCEKS
ncbi:PREDICTED: DNA repair protein REV1 [Bactrocera latifrons]|uniref:DNA repair protein REV1 n=1 Tax=Bactrocera latifrons TaxID=174628 RepID=A0A0K8VX46_BACLA|nr:PREDICTED: DNA repair protein REV1 [Bactrocera latifrons]